MKTKFLSLLILFCCVSCNQNNYVVTESLKQSIDIKNPKYLIVECYCKNGVDILKSKENKITVDVTGTLISEGYHGKQTKPKDIGKETLSFKSEYKNDTLRIISNEWTLHHHSYLIEELRVSIPYNLEYQIVKIKGAQLEGRKNE